MNDTEPKSQFEHALGALRHRILAGEFTAGTRLSEVAVAKQLGISRTPLRQAFSRLVHEGLLQEIPTGGCRVAKISMTDVMDAIELRGVVEGTAARFAAERGIKPAQAEQCREILGNIDRAIFYGDFDFESYVKKNAEFHRLMVQMSGSTVLRREAERAAQLPLASPSSFLGGQDLVPDFRRSLEVAQFQHKAIFDAIERREGARAEALVREHARLARKNLDYVIREKSNFVDRVPGLALIATEA